MCSIGGWYSQGRSRPKPEFIRDLLLLGERKGSDATGIAWRDAAGVIRIIKDKSKAKEFVPRLTDDQWRAIAQSPIGLLHNRAKTKGSEQKDHNNHPIAEFGWIVIHNGTLRNDDDLFMYHKVARPAEVDTVAINLLLSRTDAWPECFRELTVAEGGLTAAMWKAADPDRLGLIRLGDNELYLWYHDDVIYWSSVPQAGQALPYRGLGSLAFQSSAWMPEGRLLVLEPGGARTFALKRRPFVLPRAASIISPSVATPVTVVSAKPPANTKPSYQWSRSNAGHFPILKDKPPPMFEEIRPVWDDLLAENHAARTAGHGSLRTPYGTWRFWPQTVTLPSGTTTAVMREFKPCKRQKAFLASVYGNQLKLPVLSNDTTLPPIPLEKFSISNAAGVVLPGFMCPACGIVAPSTHWKPTPRCSFCRVAFLDGE